MKSLQQHLNESLVNETYKAQFKPADWKNVLNQFNPPYTQNYSQIGSLEDYIDEESGPEDWIDNMIEGGVQDTPENREILKDIFQWRADNYESKLIGWRDDAELAVEYTKDMDKDSTMWAVSMEDYVMFMIPKKKLTGNDKRFGEMLAIAANCEEIKDIAADYA
jgi:hypothetical protein